MAQGELASRYANLVTIRQPFLDRARDNAKLTIPLLVPPEGFSDGQKLPTPWQSIGARGVNNLASRLILTLFPPNTPFFRLTVDDMILEQLTGRDDARGDMEKALNKMERTVMLDLETSGVRSPSTEAVKQLLVAGNVLVYTPPEGGLRVYRLDRYCAKRDPMGHTLEIITREDLSYMELDNAARIIVGGAGKVPAEDKLGSAEDRFAIYTCITRTETGWKVYQELEGQEIPGSSGSYPLHQCPWLALRHIPVDTQDYGRSFVEEYYGDLKSAEALRKAIVQGSAAAAKVLFLVKANGSTKLSVLTETESGDVRAGNAADVTVLQMDKFADFKIAQETFASIKQDLEMAFMLNSAIQRNGERVTAEEIRYMAQELETSQGGLYSTYAQEFQLPLATLEIARLTRLGRLPALPKGSVKPTITTGVDAIGRGNDAQRLREFYADLDLLSKSQAAMQFTEVQEAVKRLAAAHGIEADGLVSTAEQIAQRQQQNMQQAMMDKLGPNAVTQIGGLAQKQIAQGAETPQPGGS